MAATGTQQDGDLPSLSASASWPFASGVTSENEHVESDGETTSHATPAVQSGHRTPHDVKKGARPPPSKQDIRPGVGRSYSEGDEVASESGPPQTAKDRRQQYRQYLQKKRKYKSSRRRRRRSDGDQRRPTALLRGVEQMVERGEELNQKDKVRTLEHGCYRHHLSCISAPSLLPCNNETTTQDGHAAIHYAALYGDVGAIQRLIKEKVDVDAVTNVSKHF